MILQAGILVSILNVVVLAALLLLRNGNFSPLEIGTQLLMASFQELSHPFWLWGYYHI